MTTIVLAEDHQIVRDGLRAILAAQPLFQLVGEAADGLEASQLVEKLKPDVLILDLTMPRLHGMEVLRQVKKTSPKTRVLVLSMHDNEAYVLEALRHDAAGYLLKDASGSELVRAVRDVANGRRYLSGSLSELAIQAYIQRKTADTAQDMLEALTDREREVLRSHYGLGTDPSATYEQVGAKLGLSKQRVRQIEQTALAKLRSPN